MKTPRTAIAVALAVAFAWAAGPAHADEALAKSKGCTACHANDKKVIGPAYKEVAKKYKGDAKARSMFVGENCGFCSGDKWKLRRHLLE